MCDGFVRGKLGQGMLRVQNVTLHTKTKSWRFEISTGLTSVCEKLRFCDGSV